MGTEAKKEEKVKDIKMGNMKKERWKSLPLQEHESGYLWEWYIVFVILKGKSKIKEDNLDVVLFHFF